MERSIDENDDETVNQKENIDSNESNSVDNGGEIGYKVDMENDTSGNRFGGDYGVGAQNCNVSESVLDDIVNDIVIVDNVVNDRGDDTELVDNNSEKSDNISAKVNDDVVTKSYASALNKNVIENENKLFMVRVMEENERKHEEMELKRRSKLKF
ncbi:hypothetical protein Tco_0206100 [Tanacetum coccineum]